MIQWKLVLLTAAGGAIGSAARYICGVLALQWYGARFPWGTLFVNVFGSLLMGIVSGLVIHRAALSADVRLFLATGVLGGFTTFSAFALDTAFLAGRDVTLSAIYVVASVALSLLALSFGLYVTRSAA